MAKSRMVNTVFWEDNYTSNLDPIEKLLFLYFLTNTSTTISGIYQVTLKKVAVETGIDKEMVEKMLLRFERDKKFFYRDGWIGIKNFIKHQNQESPQVKKGIERELSNCPDFIKVLVFNEEKVEGMDTLSHLTKLNLTELNSTKQIPEEVKDDSYELINSVIDSFSNINPACKKMFGNKSQRNASKELIETYSYDEVMNCIKNVLPVTNTKSYFPIITTPVQLRDKWVALKSAVTKKRNNAVEIIT